MIESFPELVEECRQQPPAVVIVLGSGLGDAARTRIEELAAVPFAGIPNLGASSVIGHRGRLVLGRWAGQCVLVFEGRLHFYEGHCWEQVVQSVRLAASLGVRRLILTNASGGIAERLTPGSLMVLRAHLDTTRRAWWRPPTPPSPPPYTSSLRQHLQQSAEAAGVELSEGVYAAVTGPCYETPAEVRALRTWGADAVGMSTAREAEAAAEMGLECAALSCITNRAAGLSGGALNHEEVLAVAGTQARRLADLLGSYLSRQGG